MRNHRTLASSIIVGLALLATAGVSEAGNKPTRPVTFTNPFVTDKPAHNADDLHVMMPQGGCGVKSTNPSPIGYTPQFGGRLQYFYGFSIPAGGSLTIEFECDKAPIDITAWWWTKGGNHRRHGKIHGGWHKDPADTKRKKSLHASGGPAAGNGILRIAAGGAVGHFTPMPGSDPAQAIADLTAFAATLDAGQGPVLYAAPSSDDLLYLSTAVYGDNEPPLTVEVVVPDDELDWHVLTPVGASAFVFGLEGGCPGPLAALAAGASVGHEVTVWAGTDGAGVVPSGPCAGTALDLMPTMPLGTMPIDAFGDGSTTIDEVWCGTDLLVQAVDEGTCTASASTGF